MTVLAACQTAAIKLVGYAPTALFGATGQLETELRTLANDVAEAVAKAHDWRKLTTLHTVAGDGTTTAFALPADYDRMPLKAGVYSTRSLLPLAPVVDLDQWLEMQLSGITGAPGCWIVLGGQLQVLPALAASESAKFYYQSNLAVAPGSGDNKATFTLDGDSFRLPERLITLGVVWRWKQLKGKEYAEDLRHYEIAFGEEAGRDKGSRVLAIGRARISGDATLAYPGTV